MQDFNSWRDDSSLTHKGIIVNNTVSKRKSRTKCMPCNMKRQILINLTSICNFLKDSFIFAFLGTGSIFFSTNSEKHRQSGCRIFYPNKIFVCPSRLVSNTNTSRAFNGNQTITRILSLNHLTSSSDVNACFGITMAADELV